MRFREAGVCKGRINKQFTLGVSQIKFWVLSEFEQGTAVLATNNSPPCEMNATTIKTLQNYSFY